MSLVFNAWFDAKLNMLSKSP